MRTNSVASGPDYTLLVDRADIELGNGPKHDGQWLLPCNTDRRPDPPCQDTYTLYNGVIVSTQFTPASDFE